MTADGTTKRQTTRGGARPGAGRRPVLVDGRQYKVTLDTLTANALREAGSGNLSAGIRTATAALQAGIASDAASKAASIEVARDAASGWRCELLDPTTIEVNALYGGHVSRMDDEDYRALKGSVMCASGNVSPVVVSSIGQGKAQLVIGRRRLQACVELGLPVFTVIGSMTVREAFESMMRDSKNWSPYEIGTSITTALDQGVYSSLRKLAEAVGFTVTHCLAAQAAFSLPPKVLEAFQSPTLIGQPALRALRAALEKDPDGVLRRAERLASGGVRLSAAKVLKVLTAK